MFTFPFFIGDPEPNMNITVSPSTRIKEGTNITIICDADRPQNANTSPLPIILIRIIAFIGVKRVKNCQSVPVLTCNLTIPNVTKENLGRISCKAFDSKEQCRLKILELEIINDTAGKKISIYHFKKP